MFGAIIFIPLFLQLVYGVSPTSSGLRMLPLMAGLLTASILSGRAISRIGRYKPFPIAGTAVTTVGLFLLSQPAGRHAAVGGVGLHARRRRRHRPRDAGHRARRPERRRAARHRRRDLDRDVLPLDGRLARRRAVRRDLRLAAGDRARRAAAAHVAARFARRRQHQPGARSTRSPPRSATTSCSRSSTRCSRCSSSGRR